MNFSVKLSPQMLDGLDLGELMATLTENPVACIWSEKVSHTV